MDGVIGRKVRRLPARPSAFLSVAIAFLAVAILVPGRPGRLALLVDGVGIALLALGVSARTRDRSRLGWIVIGLGVVVVVGALAMAFTRTSHRTIVTLVPGLIGITTLAAGIIPVPSRGSRGLVKLGAALVFVGVLVSGVTQSATQLLLFASGTGAVLAWDSAENAINIGEQLGREIDATRIELVHLAGTTLAGISGVALAYLVLAVGVQGVPLVGLALLLLAAVILVAALQG